MASYFKCMSAMSAQTETLNKAETEKIDQPAQKQTDRKHHLRLPPCDTEVFKGDYLSWPTFRDMFTAIYISNDDIYPIEKLYYLSQKTKGEANEIVSNAPVTNEGFEMAWKNLTERYENMRSLVKAQLDTVFGIKPIETDCGKSIKDLQLKLNNCMNALKGHNIDLWDALFVYLCAEKLPESSLSLWEQSLGNKTEIAKWEDMNKFLSDRFLPLENVSGHRGNKTSKSFKPHITKPTPEPQQKKVGSFQTSVKKFNCKMCHTNEHKLRNCTKFLKLSPAHRVDFIKSNNSCLNCLSSGHTVSKCTSSYNCSTCHSRHNTLLHIQKIQQKAAVHRSKEDDTPSTSRQAREKQNSKSNDKQTSNVQSCHAHNTAGVLLGTARINIHYNNTKISARALIDSGSECSFITERLKRRINLASKKIRAQVSSITNSFSAQVKESCSIELRSLIDPLFSLNTKVLVLPKLTGDLPT
ncbi:uncharacterized protein [Eurosta solidaginis]|uniref:uncharacterized protein n=1 Tax=Eurosta solidaginis TaxID=178769 RepID=UPI0035310A9F